MSTIKSVKLLKSDYLVTFEDGSTALYPRLTSVLDVLAKPALMWWAANQEREMCIETAVALLTDSEKMYGGPFLATHEQWGKAEFEMELRKALGDKKAHQKASQKAKDIGSETHALIQHDLKARLGKFDPEPDHSDASALAYMAWEDWRAEVGFTPVSAETPLASVTLEAGGTNDAAGWATKPEANGGGGSIRTGFLVCDWKSSKRSKTSPNGIYFEAKVQVAVYRRMGIEMGLFPEDSMACVVRLPKSEDDPVIQEKLPVDWVLLTAEECDELARGFEHIRKTWAFLAANGAI